MTQDAPLALGCTPTTSSHLHFPAQPCDRPCQRHFSTACTFFVQNTTFLPAYSGAVLRMCNARSWCQDHPGEFCHLLQLHTKLTLPATLLLALPPSSSISTWGRWEKWAAGGQTLLSSCRCCQDVPSLCLSVWAMRRAQPQRHYHVQQLWLLAEVIALSS